MLKDYQMSSQNNFFLQIQGLLKKKGWTWPPDEKLRKQIRETIQKAAGNLHTPPEVLKKVLRESGFFEE